MKHLIYGLIDPRNGHLRYVGRSSSGLSRPRQHSTPSGLKKGTHVASWCRSLSVLGLKPEIWVIEEANVSDLNTLEQEWIATAKAWGCDLVNHTDGGGGTVGWKHSLEAKNKIVLALRTRAPSVNAKPMMKGVPISEARRSSISRARGGRKIRDSEGNLYDGLYDASRKTGRPYQAIQRVLWGTRNKTGGLAFWYAEDE